MNVSIIYQNYFSVTEKKATGKEKSVQHADSAVKGEKEEVLKKGEDRPGSGGKRKEGDSEKHAEKSKRKLEHHTDSPHKKHREVDLFILLHSKICIAQPLWYYRGDHDLQYMLQSFLPLLYLLIPRYFFL